MFAGQRGPRTFLQNYRRSGPQRSDDGTRNHAPNSPESCSMRSSVWVQHRALTNRKVRTLQQQRGLPQARALDVRSPAKGTLSDGPQWADTCGYLVNRQSPLRGFLSGGDVSHCVQSFTTEEERLAVLDSKMRSAGISSVCTAILSAEAIEAAKPQLRIPEAVRIAVWRRYGGNYAQCEGREDLAFKTTTPRLSRICSISHCFTRLRSLYR